MDWAHALWLAMVQGLTEFLPISSSAHLILLPRLLGWPDQGLAFDVAVHVGTLLAVVLYFRAELVAMLLDLREAIAGRPTQGESRLALCIVVATLPVLVVGAALEGYVASTLRAPLVIALATLGFGLLLGVAARYTAGTRREASIGWTDAVVIGLAQAVALIPGTSRSGITLTAGLFLGLTPTAAARFAFLLAIPTIALAGTWKASELLSSTLSIDWGALLIGVVVAAVTAYLCISAFLALLHRFGVGPWVAYRLLLGVALLVVFH